MANFVGRWSLALGEALLAGAGFGFLARDVLGLGQPAVALAWLGGVAAVAGSERVRRRTCGRPGRSRDPR